LKDTGEDEEEGVSSYGMTLRKQEDIGNWKWKHQIGFSAGIALEEAVDLS